MTRTPPSYHFPWEIGTRGRAAATREEGGSAVTTLTEMYSDQDSRTFEERRDEVFAIVSSATDLAGVDRGLSAIVTRLGVAADESEFDLAFGDLVSAIKGTPLPADAA
jgi:hypothetical protein